MAITDYLNIHNLVTLTIRRPENRDVFSELNQPFHFFRTKAHSNDPDIVMEIGDFEPNTNSTYIVDHKYHVRENYIFCEDHYRGLQWKVEIQGFETGNTVVHLHIQKKDAKYALAPGAIYNGLFLRQLIAYHLYKKGALLVHAAACMKDGKVILLFGRGGTYKTTHLMQIMRLDKNWQFLGDDSVILFDNKVFSFPYSLSFFAYRYKFLQDEHLTLKDKLGLFPFVLQSRKPDFQIGEFGKLAVAINCKTVVGKKVEFKECETRSNFYSLIQESSVDDHTSSSIGHAQIYPRYVEAYSYVFPNNELQKRWQVNYSNHIDEKHLRSYEVEVPSDYSRKHYPELVEKFESSVSSLI